MTDEKMIERLAKLKAHAESAEKIGNEEEAQAFADMFHKLMLKHKISMSDVEYATLEQEEPVNDKTINFTKHNIKTKKARVQWSEKLASIVANAHFCKILIHRASNVISLVGRESDIEVAEYMFVTLHRMAEKIADREYVKYFHECRKAGDVSAARGFRMSFLQAFILRLKQRFDERTAKATGESSTALVRVDKAKKAVDEFMDEHYSKKARALSPTTRVNRAGVQRGTDLANNVELGAKAVKTGRKSSGLLK